MNTAATIRRLDRLSDLINRYAHRWNETPSPRLAGWVDEYNNLKDDMIEAKVWASYCDDRGWDKTHNGYDILA